LAVANWETFSIDRSWLSKKRSRLPHEVDEKVFDLKIGMVMLRVPTFMRTTQG